MQQSTALPVLRMLPTKSLVPHEDCDPRRVKKLSKRILEEGILKNPPVVAQISGSDKYVVLDGANRSMAFAEVRVKHIVAQVVSYDDPGVDLDTWYHVVSDMDESKFEAALQAIEGLKLISCSLEDARQSMLDGAALSYIVTERQVRKLISVDNKFNSRMELLKELVGAYRGKADIFRASNDIWEIQKPFYPQIIALVIFSRLKPLDILNAGKTGERVPSGITRHIIPTRALNINIPIGILMSDWTIDQKREWLNEWWMERMGANSIRYYAESTFSFNE